MAVRETIGMWGTRIGLGGAALFGTGGALIERMKNGAWDWDWNEEVAVLFAIAGLASFIFGGPRPVAYSGRKKKD